MASLMRDDVIKKIVSTARDFSDFLRANREAISGHSGLLGYADKSHELSGAPAVMTEMLMKLNDEALLAMYRMSGEVADQYELPGRNAMTGYAAEEMSHSPFPIRWDAGLNRLFFEGPDNANLDPLDDQIRQFHAKADRAYSIFTQIIGSLSTIDTDRESGIIAQFESGLRFAAGMVGPLSELLPIFTDEASREKVHSFLEAVREAARSVDRSSARREISSNSANIVFREDVPPTYLESVIQNMATSTRNLSTAISDWREERSERRAERQEERAEQRRLREENDELNWLDLTRRAIDAIIKFILQILPGVEMVSLIPPVWNVTHNRLPNSNLRIEGIPLKAIFTNCYVQGNNEITLFFSWALEDNATVSGWDINHVTGTTNGVTELGFRYFISHSDNNGFSVTFNPSVALNELTTLGAEFRIGQNGNAISYSIVRGFNSNDSVRINFFTDQQRTKLLFGMDIGAVSVTATAGGFGSGNHDLSMGVNIDPHEGRFVIGGEVNLPASDPNTLGLFIQSADRRLRWGANILISASIDAPNLSFPRGFSFLYEALFFIEASF